MCTQHVTETWVSVSLKEDIAPDFDKAWLASYRTRYHCPGCGYRKREFAGSPVDAVLTEEPPKVPMNSLFPVHAGVAQESFIELFFDVGRQYLRLGRVLAPSGRPYVGFVTYTAAFALVPRGGPKSAGNPCELCGRLRYYPNPPSLDKRYLTPHCLTSGQLFYLSRTCSLIMTENVLQRVDLRTRKKLRVNGLPIRDEPLDGLKEFPSFWL